MLSTFRAMDEREGARGRERQRERDIEEGTERLELNFPSSSQAIILTRVFSLWEQRFYWVTRGQHFNQLLPTMPYTRIYCQDIRVFFHILILQKGSNTPSLPSSSGYWCFEVAPTTFRYSETRQHVRGLRNGNSLLPIEPWPGDDFDFILAITCGTQFTLPRPLFTTPLCMPLLCVQIHNLG